MFEWFILVSIIAQFIKINQTFYSALFLKSDGNGVKLGHSCPHHRTELSECLTANSVFWLCATVSYRL